MRPVHTLPSYSFGGHEIFDTIGEYTKQLGKKTVIIGGDLMEGLEKDLDDFLSDLIKE